MSHTIRLLIICFTIFTCTKAQVASTPDLYTGIDQKSFRKHLGLNEPIDLAAIDHNLLHAAIFHVTNEQRVKQKLSAVTFHPLLEKMSVSHSRDMHEENFFGHENPNDATKRTPNDRARLTGVKNPFIAENVAEVFALTYTPNTEVYILGPGKFSYKAGGEPILTHTYLSLADELVSSWMNSKGHRQNILSKDAVQLGCGVYFYIDNEFNDMPAFKATQCFQWYETLKSSN